MAKQRGVLRASQLSAFELGEFAQVKDVTVGAPRGQGRTLQAGSAQFVEWPIDRPKPRIGRAGVSEDDVAIDTISRVAVNGFMEPLGRDTNFSASLRETTSIVHWMQRAGQQDLVTDARALRRRLNNRWSSEVRAGIRELNELVDNHGDGLHVELVPEDGSRGKARLAPLAGFCLTKGLDNEPRPGIILSKGLNEQGLQPPNVWVAGVFLPATPQR
jgi:hypothetical protein